MGTLYRRFPTKEDLIDAVLEDSFDAFAAAAERSLEEDDPWAGFSGFVERDDGAARREPCPQGRPRDGRSTDGSDSRRPASGCGRCFGS